MRTNYHGGEAKYRDMRTNYHGGKAKYRDMRTDYHGGKAKYRDMRTNYHGGKAKYRDMRTNHHGSEVKYRDMRTDYHGSEAKYRDMRTDYHGGEAKYRDMRTNYHGGKAKYRDIRVGFSPARVLKDLKDFKDLKDLFYSAPPFGLKAQKPQAQGKANNVSRHPGWTTSRMVRPTGAKATKRRKEKGERRKQKEPCGVFLPMLHFSHFAPSKLLLFQSALPPTLQLVKGMEE